MRKTIFILLFLSLSLSKVLAREGFRVMFYNVENFFDCQHDTLKNDFEFLPGGIRGWPAMGHDADGVHLSLGRGAFLPGRENDRSRHGMRLGQLHDALGRHGALNRSTPAARQHAGDQSMTTIQIQLPDELAQNAQAAGLLTPQAIEAMLREQLRRQAGESLRATWQRLPQEELTPEIEQMIVEEVRTVRAERRKRNAG